MFSSERTYTLLSPPRELTLKIPPGLPFSGGVLLPSYLKTFLDVRQLGSYYGYMSAARMQLSLQGEETLVCSQAPLLFSSHFINLIKDVASPYKLYSLSEGTEGSRGICILNRTEIVA